MAIGGNSDGSFPLSLTTRTSNALKKVAKDKIQKYKDSIRRKQ